MTSDKKMVVIVDDHPMFRIGLKSILARDDTYEVVGEAGTAVEALKLAKKQVPDYMIIDISLPDKNGIELTREVLRLLPDCKVLIVSMHTKIFYVTEALRMGALGYLVKESTSETLLKGLNAVSKGRRFVDPSLSKEIAEDLGEAGESNMVDIAYKRLTKREQEIMRLVAEGFTTKEIAERLFISIKTVDNHRANIMNKLGIHRTVELIRYAARIGLIDLDT
ncbi:MAG: response regulator transcription factor [Deltaproteobacteria bacterium]|nr:response regulator transcription factor [Deltaproteobacteria bacterium]